MSMQETEQPGSETSLAELLGPAPEDDGENTRELYLILYPKELEDEIIRTLEAVHVPGYTELPKMVGRGRHIRHFDNAVWPGATGAVISIMTPEEGRYLVPPFKALAERLETRSHGLYGVHMFVLPCRQLI
jgi:hypothetical protein